MIAELFYQFFVNDVFGSTFIFGIAIIALFTIFSLKMRMSFASFGIVFCALITVLAGFNYIPRWIIIIEVMIFGLIIGIGLLKTRNY